MELLATMTAAITRTIDSLPDLSFSVGHVTLNLYVVLKAIAVICILLWLSGLAVRLLDARLARVRDMRASNRTLILKIFQIMLYCMVFMVGMQVLGISLTALSVFGGALGVGLGFGLQKIASNFVSGIILLFEKSIEVGDLIELSDGTTGFIRQTHARYTLLETQDGKEVLIPNEEFISQRVISWTHSDTLARAQISVTLAYDTDFNLAKRLMLEAANAHPKRDAEHPSLAVLHAFADHGVELHLYFWVRNVIDGRMEPRSDVMQAMLTAFNQHGIRIPYPQREVRVTDTTQSMAGEGA